MADPPDAFKSGSKRWFGVVNALAIIGIDVVHTSDEDIDEDLSVGWFRCCNLSELKDFRPAGLFNLYCLHGYRGYRLRQRRELVGLELPIL